MNKVAIAFLTKDRTEQSRQSIEPLWKNLDKIDLHWVDGSIDEQALAFHEQQERKGYAEGKFPIVRGGADAAIVFALTQMLAVPRYTHVGLCEQDVLLRPGWFEGCMALFDRGRQHGLEVGAVSARCYQDRILCQRDNYALCHNLGAGHVIFTRAAAEIILRHYRTGHTWENRAIFAQLSGLDISKWWCFGPYIHGTTVDWGFDAVLARHGLASLALVPNCATMLEDIGPMGLKYADQPVEMLRDDRAFETFAERTGQIRDHKIKLHGYDSIYRDLLTGEQTIFAHQLLAQGAEFAGAWKLRWSQGFGPFCWQAAERGATLMLPMFGECHLVISGGKTHARLHAQAPGLDWETTIEAEVPGRETVRLSLSGDFIHRTVRITALTAGLCVFGMQTRAPQAVDPGWRFDWSCLPLTE